MSVISTSGLRKAYRGKVAVAGIDLVVPEGACVILIGANGAGKSTTLQMLMNLQTPSGGTATVVGEDSRRLKAADFQRIGYASESQVLPGLTTSQLFDYLRTLYPRWDASFEADLRRRLKIPDRRRLRALSRGERMKVCIAASLAFRPEVAVMDEPLGGLDPLSREEVVRLLIESAAETTLLISSHDLSDLERLATHVAVMHEGRIVVQEEVETLLDRFREITVRDAGLESIRERDWLNLRREGETVRFVHQRFGAGAEASLAAAFGSGARVSAGAMTLPAIASALLRALDAGEEMGGSQ